MTTARRSAALVALIGLLQYFWGMALLPQAFPPAATFVNKNVGAGFVLLVTVLKRLDRREAAMDPLWRNS